MKRMSNLQIEPYRSSPCQNYFITFACKFLRFLNVGIEGSTVLPWQFV